MKKIYATAEIIISSLNQSDIVTSSGGENELPRVPFTGLSSLDPNPMGSE